MSNLIEGSLDKENINYKLNKKSSYGDYLCLDQILNAQKYRSEHHNTEHLFITIHQISELWLSIILMSLKESLASIKSDDIGSFLIGSKRIFKSQDQLIAIWDVLSTMTPNDYLSIRDALGEASGFQSYQYRMVEFILGNKNKRLSDVFAYDPILHKNVLETLKSPSLYDEVIMLLTRRGILSSSITESRDWSTPYTSSKEVTIAWLEVYKTQEKWSDLYLLGETLIDLEYRFQKWRFCHFKSVERLIGHKSGTGGTRGVSYLKKALDLTFFPELYHIRTLL
jgi:tryptophan 2,3-dioxygenase